uniref:AlNc14C79G5211 protein n=1 Tax=Albugo laibachii Nc14 TaxID=890382 RepID=F0WF17_9STRA|nr:AlNc14C79G5211 [Albugo laibachii Nc14]|eukprot:CCA19799.1 AlNc14C79G5211 [Albugo laibachii Nc14]
MKEFASTLPTTRVNDTSRSLMEIINARNRPLKCVRVGFTLSCNSRSSRGQAEATDTERIRTFMATSRLLRKRLLPIFEDIYFCLAFRMLPVRTRF